MAEIAPATKKATARPHEWVRAGREDFGSALRPKRQQPASFSCYAVEPKAWSISDNVAFSASLTRTPPKPRKVPSLAACATLPAMSRNHVLNPAASLGAL